MTSSHTQTRQRLAIAISFSLAGWAASCKSDGMSHEVEEVIELSGHWIAPRAEKQQMDLYLKDDKAYVLIGSSTHPEHKALICRTAEQGRWRSTSSRAIITSPVDIQVSAGCERPGSKTEEGIVHESGMHYRGLGLKRGRPGTPALTWDEAIRYVNGIR